MNTYLLIDDDNIIQFVHQNVIGKTDPDGRVFTVSSVEEAFRFLSDSNQPSPNLVFLDINMPIQNGFDFLDELQLNHEDVHRRLKQDARVFLLTSSVNPRDVDKSKEYPIIEGLIPKPLNPALLESLLVS
jgi:response regulator of citrate/malate metabolism